MPNTSQAHMSRVEEIEVRRRHDQAFAAIRPALRLFSRKASLEEEEKNKSRQTTFNLQLGAFLALLCADSVADWLGHPTTFFKAIAFIVLMAIVIRAYRLDQIRKELVDCNDRLYSLEMEFTAAVGGGEFNELSGIAGKNTYETRQADYSTWWQRQRELILERVQR